MSPAEQLSALEEGAGLLRRAGHGVFTVQGGEAADFLHRMITQDVKSLRPGSGAPSCFTDRMAKIVAPMRLYRTEDGFLGLTDPGVVDELVKKLGIYIFGADVQLTDVSAERVVFGVHGAGAAALLEGLGVELPEEGAFHHRTARLAGAEVQVLRVEDLGLPGFDLVASSGDSEAIVEALEGAGATELDGEVATALRVEAGTPLFGVDYDGEFMPPEVGLQESVSYSKGCYIGQEILERLRSRGKVTKLLRVVELEGEPPPDGELEVSRGGKILGRLTSLVRSPRSGKLIGLASLPASKAGPGDTVEVAGREGLVREPGVEAVDPWARMRETGAALKEWAALIRGLEQGTHAVLLRKGGIHERGFDVKTPAFLLFPTYLHQEPDKFRPGHEGLYQETQPEADPEGARITVRAAAEVIDSVPTTDREKLPALAALTAMTDEALGLRYNWKPEQALHVLVVRVRPLAEPLELDMKKAWGGCRSWIEVGPRPELELGEPVLDDAALEEIRREVHGILGE